MRLAAVATLCAVMAAACSADAGTPDVGPVSSDPVPSTSVATTPPSDSGIPVILDYSPTVSDVGALLYLLSEPRVRLLAVTMPATGEAACDLGLQVTLRVLALYGRDDVPVACGSRVPPTAGVWPEAFLAGSRNLGFGLPAAIGVPDERDAPGLLADVIARADVPVVLVAVAPLTDLADALELDPGLTDGLDRIVIMGGAVDVPGNVFTGPVEWNVWIDVEAASRVLTADVPTTLVPLDATNDVPVPSTWRLVLERADGGPGLDALRRLAALFPAVTSGGFYLWDELAAMVAVDPTIVATASLPVSVVTTGPRRGATVHDPAGRELVVATGVPDPDLVYVRFLSGVAGEEVALHGRADEATVGYFTELRASFRSGSEVLQTFTERAFGEPFDADAAADALLAFGEALRDHADALVGIVPPADLESLHAEYASAVGEAIAFVGPFAERLRDADSAEAAFDEVGPLEFDRACEALTHEAAYRGFDLVLFCGR
jgi:pyrimidine-specific ribonucleoside hydrolase